MLELLRQAAPTGYAYPVPDNPLQLVRAPKTRPGFEQAQGRGQDLGTRNRPGFEQARDLGQLVIRNRPDFEQAQAQVLSGLSHGNTQVQGFGQNLMNMPRSSMDLGHKGKDLVIRPESISVKSQAMDDRKKMVSNLGHEPSLLNTARPATGIDHTRTKTMPVNKMRIEFDKKAQKQKQMLMVRKFLQLEEMEKKLKIKMENIRKAKQQIGAIQSNKKEAQRSGGNEIKPIEKKSSKTIRSERKEKQASRAAAAAGQTRQDPPLRQPGTGGESFVSNVWFRFCQCRIVSN